MLVLVRLVHQDRVDAEVVEVLEVLPAVEKVARPRLDVPRPYGVAPFAQLLRLVLRCLLQLAGLAVHAVLPQHADHLLRLLALHRDVALLALLGVVDAVKDGLRDDDHVPVVVADLRVEVLPLLLAGVPFAQAKHLGVRVQRAGALGELGQRGVLHHDKGLAGDAQPTHLHRAAYQGECLAGAHLVRQQDRGDCRLDDGLCLMRQKRELLAVHLRDLSGETLGRVRLGDAHRDEVVEGVVVPLRQVIHQVLLTRPVAHPVAELLLHALDPLGAGRSRVRVKVSFP